MKKDIVFWHFESNTKFQKPRKPTYAECLSFFSEYLKRAEFLREEDLEGMDKYWEYFSSPKNKAVVMPGDVCPYLVFICSGAIKYFTEDAKGKHIIAFATKGYFCTAVPGFVSQTATNDGLFCVENTVGLKLSFSNFKALLKERPAFRELYKKMSQEGYQRMQNRLKAFQSHDARGRYELLLKENSSVFNHFTMQDISNYLGIKPETLSRLRNGREMQIR